MNTGRKWLRKMGASNKPVPIQPATTLSIQDPDAFYPPPDGLEGLAVRRSGGTCIVTYLAGGMRYMMNLSVATHEELLPEQVFYDALCKLKPNYDAVLWYKAVLTGTLEG